MKQGDHRGDHMGSAGDRNRCCENDAYYFVRLTHPFPISFTVTRRFEVYGRRSNQMLCRVLAKSEYTCHLLAKFEGAERLSPICRSTGGQGRPPDAEC